jgi:hypothetical protein
LLIGVADAVLVAQLGEQGAFWFTSLSRTLLLALVAICAAITANRFRWWGDYAGRAWTLFCIAYTLLAASEVVRRFLPERFSNARETLVLIANLAIIGAYWLFARSMHAAGLDYDGSQTKRIAVIVLAVLLAALLCSSSVMGELTEIRAGNARPGSLVSVLADMITFVLVAPLLLTAFALRGGRLFWMFALLTAGTFGWMVNQGSAGVFRTLGWESAVHTGRMVGFAIACCFIAAAALTQILATRRSANEELAHA